MTTTHQPTAPQRRRANTLISDTASELIPLINEWQHRTNRARVRARVHERGESLGPIHFGYRKASTRAKRAGYGFPRPSARTAPLVEWAFETFATNDLTVTQLAAALAEHAASRGRSRVPKLPTSRRLRAILSNPYYIGLVRYDGATYPGAHEALIPSEVFKRVQERLGRNHRSEGEQE